MAIQHTSLVTLHADESAAAKIAWSIVYMYVWVGTDSVTSLYRQQGLLLCWRVRGQLSQFASFISHQTTSNHGNHPVSRSIPKQHHPHTWEVSKAFEAFRAGCRLVVRHMLCLKRRWVGQKCERNSSPKNDGDGQGQVTDRPCDKWNAGRLQTPL